MSEIQQVGDLEIGIDQKFQQREWRMERIGWVIMLLIIAAGLLGLLGGPGLLSSTSAVSGDSLEVNYERYLHLLEATSLELRVVPEQGQDTIRVWLSQSYLEDMLIEAIMPEPENVQTGADRTIFSFALAEPVQEMRINFQVSADRPGSKAGAAGIEGGQSIELSQVVYP